MQRSTAHEIQARARAQGSSQCLGPSAALAFMTDFSIACSTAMQRVQSRRYFWPGARVGVPSLAAGCSHTPIDIDTDRIRTDTISSMELEE